MSVKDSTRPPEPFDTRGEDPVPASGPDDHDGELALTGSFLVDESPADAFVLFTARGEESWVPEWRPHFPVPTIDDTRVGIVFQTPTPLGTATWVVTHSDPPRSISYAQFVEGRRVTLVEVSLESAGAGSRITVTYRVCPLDADARALAQDFAATYEDFLRQWARLIRGRHPRPETHGTP